MATSRRVSGPTPQGGAWGRMFFFSRSGRLVDEEDAECILAVEYDGDGGEVHRTWLEPDRAGEMAEVLGALLNEDELREALKGGAL